MAKAKFSGFRSLAEGGGDVDLTATEDITEGILDADMILRSLGFPGQLANPAGDGAGQVPGVAPAWSMAGGGLIPASAAAARNIVTSSGQSCSNAAPVLPVRNVVAANLANRQQQAHVGVVTSTLPVDPGLSASTRTIASRNEGSDGLADFLDGKQDSLFGTTLDSSLENSQIILVNQAENSTVSMPPPSLTPAVISQQKSFGVSQGTRHQLFSSRQDSGGSQQASCQDQGARLRLTTDMKIVSDDLDFDAVLDRAVAASVAPATNMTSVINPSTLAPVLATASIVTPVSSPIQHTRDALMFPTTLQHRTIIKGVRSLNRTSQSTPTSPGGSKQGGRSSGGQEMSTSLLQQGGRSSGGQEMSTSLLQQGGRSSGGQEMSTSLLQQGGRSSGGQEMSTSLLQQGGRSSGGQEMSTNLLQQGGRSSGGQEMSANLLQGARTPEGAVSPGSEGGQLVPGSVKEEGSVIVGLESSSAAGPMDVDSLNILQSFLSIEPGASTVCEHHPMGSVDIASLFTPMSHQHQHHHQHHQHQHNHRPYQHHQLAGASSPGGVDPLAVRPTQILQHASAASINNSQVVLQQPGGGAAGSIMLQHPTAVTTNMMLPQDPTASNNRVILSHGPISSTNHGMLPQDPIAVTNHVMLSQDQTAATNHLMLSQEPKASNNRVMLSHDPTAVTTQSVIVHEFPNKSMVDMKPVFNVPASSPSSLPSPPPHQNQMTSLHQKHQGDTLVWKKEEVSPRTTPRPSPQSTPPPPPTSADQTSSGIATVRGADSRSWKRSGRSTPTGKRSRPQTPTNYTSDGEMSDGGGSAGSSGYHSSQQNRDRTETGGSGARVSNISQDIKYEEAEDEDKYNKRKKQGGGEGASRKDSGGRGKDPIKLMLEELQSSIPHIGNPNEEKVSHAGLLLEGSDYIRSLKRENNTLQENIETMKSRIEDLNKEIESAQEKLPEHGSQSIHKILSTKGKSIPDMFADHVRHRTQADWRYWVFTSIMGHFVHTFAQDVSNISPTEMERTSLHWLQERMSLQQLRKDAFRKLAKLCSKTSIMEDATRLPDEARGFVALPAPNSGTKEETEELDPPAFRNKY